MYDNMTFGAIMQRMLDAVPVGVDKREGSIIYDALAPAAAEIAITYLELQMLIRETFADTATREYLIKRCAERGITPESATSSIVVGEFFPDTLDLTGKRFSCDGLNFVCVEPAETGGYELKCEAEGSAGNISEGNLVPIEYISSLQTARITGLLIPGKDEEETESLRTRYFDGLSVQAFGGNVSDYKYKVNNLDGVGGCRVYPVWNGGGTVKVVIVDAQYNTPSDTLVSYVQNELDPTEESGKGRGLAPIGHIVTVAGAESIAVNIITKITYNPGHNYATSKTSIEGAIDEYFAEIRSTWENDGPNIVRISQIESRLLGLDEIVDVQDASLNGVKSNLSLEANQLPIRGAFADGA